MLRLTRIILSLVLSLLVTTMASGFSVVHCLETDSFAVEGFSHCDDDCCDSNCSCMKVTTVRLSVLSMTSKVQTDFAVPLLLLSTHQNTFVPLAMGVERGLKHYAYMSSAPPPPDVQALFCSYLI